MSVTIRRERLDAPVAAQLIERLQADLAVRYGEPDPTPTPVEAFAPPVGAFFVAELDGRPVGCAGVRLRDLGRAELKRMYVDPAVRRRGVARALLAAIEDEARRLGVDTLVLETGLMQPEAIALYYACGYVDLPEKFHPEWENSRIMSKALRADCDAPLA